jgi:hypothetical protein
VGRTDPAGARSTIRIPCRLDRHDSVPPSTGDLVRIYRAHDKLKATLTSASGWAAATAAGAAFAAYWTPADIAGPWAWLAHGVGTLVAGGVGYWFGSEVTRYIYELAVE